MVVSSIISRSKDVDSETEMFTNIFISSPSSPHKQQHNKQEEVKESQSSRYLHHVVFVSRSEELNMAVQTNSSSLSEDLLDVLDLE